MFTRVLVISFLSVSLPAMSTSLHAQESASTKATYLVTGLHCPPCTQTVQNSLARTKGVKSIAVDWNAKSAKVEFDESVLPAQSLAQKIAATPHMMGSNMHYVGWLSIKVPSVKDADTGQVAKDAVMKVEGVSQVAVYPQNHSIAIQFSSKGKLTSQDVIKALAKAGIDATN